ncbi:MAG TPA: ATP-binding cassette domain-containing protein, partial [Bacteroidetes bacterium]|nr:ATP-binding cassette domain-containing protein [Bacteroidota bacterium]
MLEISHLSKTYSKGLVPKRIQALRDLSLSVQPGEVYAFVGPNGAGKTTTIKAILGIISVDRGSIRINGVDHRRKEARRWVGYLPDQPY